MSRFSIFFEERFSEFGSAIEEHSSEFGSASDTKSKNQFKKIARLIPVSIWYTYISNLTLSRKLTFEYLKEKLAPVINKFLNGILRDVIKYETNKGK